MGIRSNESGKLDSFLDGTVQAVENAKLATLKKAASDTKKAVIARMPLTNGKRRHKHRKRMVDGVQAQLVPDKIYGGKRVRVRGDRQTGSLWHILNNGTYRQQATHFLDKAMADVEAGLDATLDIALREEYK